MPETESAGGIALLIVDDDRRFCALIKDYLEPMGYRVAGAHTGPEGLELALAGSYQVVILDVMLPGMDGFEVLARLRKKSEVPVLMLTARAEETDRVVGLEIGADDYLPKPFSSRELLARLRAITRRSLRPRPPTEDAAEPDLVVGPLRIQPTTRRALLDDQPVDLTPVEFDLLMSLARSSGRVKTREQLLEAVREREYEVFDRSIDVHISALRKKLKDDFKAPRFIRTLRSAGYMLIDPARENW